MFRHTCFICFRIALSFFVVLRMAPTLQAQDFISLYEPPLPAATYSAWLDYDLDGDPDLLISGAPPEGGETTFLYQNNNGFFTRTDQSFEQVGGALQVVDQQNDGDPDIYIYDAEDQILYLFINGGTASDTPFFHSGPVEADALLWTDFDADGDLDYLMAIGKRVLSYTYAGGIFSLAQLPLIAEEQIEELHVADYNLNGDPDILIRYEGTTHIYYRLVDGLAYEEDETNNFVVTAGPAWSFDYDSDGDMDLLISGQVNAGDARSGYLYRNNGGNFTLTSGITLFETGFPQLMDLDNDGDLDLIRTNDAGESLYYQKTFGDHYDLIEATSVLYDFKSLAAVSSTHTGVPAASDFLCLAGQREDDADAMILYTWQDGAYQNTYRPSPFEPLHSATILAWVDYNKDGLPDAHVTGLTDGGEARDLLVKNTGDGFETVYTFSTPCTGRGDWIDFNDDGTVDLVAVVGEYVVLYQGFQNLPNVTSSALFNSIPASAEIQAIDFDQDGDMDIYVSGVDQGLYVNDGGTFTKSDAFATEGASVTLGKAAWADYDLDGDDDVVMNINIGPADAMPRFYRNDDGTFNLVDDAFTFTYLEDGRAYALDYNLDEYPDILVVGKAGAQTGVILYANQGDGTFKMQNSLVNVSTIDPDAHQAGVMDFNHDGYPDFMITSNHPTTGAAGMLLATNQQNNTFNATDNHDITPLNDMNFAWGDFDNDGDQDVLVNGQTASVPATKLLMNVMEDVYGPAITGVFPRNTERLEYDDGYDLAVTFHEPVVVGSGAIRFYNKENGALITSADVESALVSIEENVAHIHFTDDVFDGLEEIYIKLDAGAFTDAVGNANTGITSSTRWVLLLNKARRPQNISFVIPHGLEVPIDVTPFSITATATSGLPVTFTSSNTEVAVMFGSTFVPVALGTTTITATQAGNDDYEPISIPLEFSVVKRTQSITFDALPMKRIDDAPVTLTAVASSGLPVSYTSSDPTVATIADNILTPVGAGTTTITASQPGDDVYEAATPVTQEFTVVAERQPQTITFEVLPDKTVDDAPFTLTAVASSGLLVAYTSSNPAVASVAGAVVTPLSAGEATITAAQEGSDIWLPAAPVARVLKVSVISAIPHTPFQEGPYVYPSPASQSITINTGALPFTNTRPIQLSIMDAQGRNLTRYTCVVGEDCIISLTDLPAGLYILKAMQDDEMVWQRFTKG